MPAMSSRIPASKPKRGRRAVRYATPALLLLVVLLAEPLIWSRDQVSCGDLGPADGAVPRDDPPYLILLQRRTTEVHTSRTPYIVENIETIESLPFDGMVVNIAPSWEIMRGQPIAYEEIYGHWLAPLDGTFTRFTHNFVEVMIDDPGDVFDDAAWTVTVENWRTMARAAREAGFAGIFFDNEEYTGRWLNYPEDYADPARSLAEYQAQTRLRGRQIMMAISAEYPEITLLVYHGPYLSEPATPPEVIAGQAGPGDASNLGGWLFVGFLEGLGPRATLVDGGEVYAYRTAEDFARSYDWRKSGMVADETGSALVSPALRDLWADRVSIAYGLYNLPFPTANQRMTPEIMRDALENALRTADRFVWFYAYGDNWLIPGDVSTCWRQAVEGARGAVAGGASDGVASGTMARVPTTGGAIPRWAPAGRS